MSLDTPEPGLRFKPNPTPSGAFKKTRNYSFVDDSSADYTDETKVDRREIGDPTKPIQNFQRELSTVVEAVIGADLAAPWIATIRRESRGVRPMKWDLVSALVLTRTSTEAIATREGLGAQVLVVTDPMRVVRRLDLSLADVGRLAIPNAAHLFSRQGPKAAMNLAAASSGFTRDLLRRYVFQSILDSSGLGLLCDHIATADSGELDGEPKRRGVRSDAVMNSVVGVLDGDLNKAAKLASKATALAVPIMDPDHAGASRVRRRAEPFVETRGWGDSDSLIARQSLEVVSERRLVVDGGHQDITDLTAKLRDLAEVHSQGPFDREQAFDAIKQAREEGRSRGYVRAGDDRQELLLQVADIASGWARTIIATKGYRELAKVFRCVLYNGRQVTPELASRLDIEIAEHRKLVKSYVRRM